MSSRDTDFDTIELHPQSTIDNLFVDETSLPHARLLDRSKTPEHKNSIETFRIIDNVDDPEEDVLKLSSSNTRPARETTVYQRVGPWFSILSICSVIVLLAALRFLSWIYWGDKSRPWWRHMMVRGWSKQAVTLSAIAIRFAVASLATTATAMIAALAIETRGVPIDDLAQVSIARFSNNGPETFWISGLFNKAFLGIRLRVPLLLLLCTAVASQFTSTLLLSDFDQGLVTGFANQETILLATSPTIISTTVEDAELNFTTKDSYWSRYPKQFAAFAEYTEPGDSSDGVEDTGVTLRSFLPFSDQNDRASLLEFNGVAPVFDTRCLCVRPTFTSLLFDVTGPGDSGTMIGQISYANKIPGMPAPFVYNLTAEALGANVTDQILPTNFSCELRAWKPRERTICILKGQSSILEYLPGHEWPGGLAWVNDGLVSALDPIFDQTERGKSSWMPSPNTGNAYLIVESPSRPGVFLKAQPAPGPWSAVTLRNTTNNFDCSICWSDLTKPNCTHCVEISFRTSLCFDAFVSSMS